MFYALILWFCAGQMSPAILLGQTTAVVLLLGLGWQTLSVRREKTPVYQQTPVVLTPEVVGGWAKNKLNQLRIAPDSSVRPVLARSLKSTTKERLRQNLDPRRRPVYDYEFVEDGLLETVEQPFEEPANNIDSNIDMTTEPLEPPSAVAEVLLEITPAVEGEVVESETAESEAHDTVKADTSETVTSEVQTPEIQLIDDDVVPEPVSDDVQALANVQKATETVDGQAVEKETEQQTDTPPKEIASEEIAPEEIAPATDIDEDDWDDNFLTDDFLTSSPSAGSSDSPSAKDTMAVRTKPSLLATPVILAGWVKDVVTSLTKPKPSKPVIEIPQRDSPLVVQNPAGVKALETTPSTAEPSVGTAPAPEPPSEPTFTSPKADEPAFDTSDSNEQYFDEPATETENNWEESNWDD